MLKFSFLVGSKSGIQVGCKPWHWENKSTDLFCNVCYKETGQRENYSWPFSSTKADVSPAEPAELELLLTILAHSLYLWWHYYLLSYDHSFWDKKYEDYFCGSGGNTWWGFPATNLQSSTGKQKSTLHKQVFGLLSVAEFMCFTLMNVACKLRLYFYFSCDLGFHCGSDKPDTLSSFSG